METSKQQFDIKQNGSLAQVVHMNLAQGFADKLWFQIASGRLFITFGCFLLGLCAWRTRIFGDSPQDRALMQRVALWTGVVAAVTSIIAWIFPPGMMLMDRSELWPYISGCVQQVTLAAFYFSAVLSIYWRCNATSWIHQLGPMGKMGLTSYLSQSVFGVLVFYGFGLGLLGRIGVVTGLALGVAFFICQVFVARWWMRRFSQGPIEWLWRSATDRKLQPFLRPPVAAA